MNNQKPIVTLDLSQDFANNLKPAYLRRYFGTDYLAKSALSLAHQGVKWV